MRSKTQGHKESKKVFGIINLSNLYISYSCIYSLWLRRSCFCDLYSKIRQRFVQVGNQVWSEYIIWIGQINKYNVFVLCWNITNRPNSYVILLKEGCKLLVMRLNIITKYQRTVRIYKDITEWNTLRSQWTLLNLLSYQFEPWLYCW